MLSSSLSSGISNSTSPYMGESPLQPLPPLFVPSVPSEESSLLYDGIDLRGTNETVNLGSYFPDTVVLKQYQEFIDYITQNYGSVFNFDTLEFQKK